MGSFHITSQIHQEILDRLSEGKKIAAIKALRTATQCALRPAKEAIERLEHERFGKIYPSAARSGFRIYSGPKIKKLVLDYGQGEIEVDLDGMQMITLMEMQSTGLDICREMLDFVDLLKAYSSGKKIGLIEDKTEDGGQ